MLANAARIGERRTCSTSRVSAARGRTPTGWNEATRPCASATHRPMESSICAGMRRPALARAPARSFARSFVIVDADAARARRLHRIRPAVPRGPPRSPADLTTAAEADLCDGANGLGACTLRALARRVATLNATRSSQSISRVEAERSLLVEYGVVRPSVPDDRPSARPPHSLFCPCSLHHRSRTAP